MASLIPGQLVHVKEFSLVRKFASDEEHYAGMQNGLVVAQSHQWHELTSGDVSQTYLVFLSEENKLYYVFEKDMLPLDVFGQEDIIQRLHRMAL